MAYNKDCYDRETNECDGRCQGASDCPWAQFFRSRMYDGETDLQEPTREDMDAWHKQCNEMHEIQKQLFAKLDEDLRKDPELRKRHHMKLLPDGTLKSTFFEDMKNAEKSEEG